MIRRRLRLCVVLVLVGLVPVGAASQRSAPAPSAPSSAAATSTALLDILRAEMDRNVEVLRRSRCRPTSWPTPSTRSDRPSSRPRSGPWWSTTTASRARSAWTSAPATTRSTTPTRSAASRRPRRASAGPRFRSPTRRPASEWPRGWPPTAPTASRSSGWRASRPTWRPRSRRRTRPRTSRARIRRSSSARPPPFRWTRPRGKPRLRRISALFADDPLILQGDVALERRGEHPLPASTPRAAALLTGDTACRLFIQAQTKADDGMELPLYATYFARSLAGLPDEAQLARRRARA